MARKASKDVSALTHIDASGEARMVDVSAKPATERIAVAEGCYYGTPTLFRELERWGLKYVEFDQTGPPPDDAQLVWLEAPSNPFLTMPDFEAAAAHVVPSERLAKKHSEMAAPGTAKK